MRLRDFSFIKIFLIAIVWSYVTGVIPMYEQGIPINTTIIYFLEMICFFIAITIPFDIRDFSVDTANNVQTIPTLIGRRPSINLALLLLFLTFLIDLGLTFQYDHGMNGFICMTVTCILTAIAIRHIRDKESDYYYSGLLDTTIMFPYSLFVLISIF
jgi:4-hydroxybenzoate polyprenyltransferase